MKINHSLRRLFVSRTRHKLIQLFFYHPGTYYFVRQLTRLTGEEINSVRRELANLKSASIISSEVRANKLYYTTNNNSSMFRDLLVFANKSIGLGSSVLEGSSKNNSLKLLLYSFEFALGHSNPDSVDLIMVGDLQQRDVESLIKDEEQRRGHEINYMLMSRSEYHLRRQRRDPFMVEFFLNYPLLIVGNPSDIIST